MYTARIPLIRNGMIGPCEWLIALIRLSGPMVPILSLIWIFWILFRYQFPIKTSCTMDQTFAYRNLLYQHSHSDSPFPFFVGSHSILRTHRVHGATIEWCCGSVLQWYHGLGIIVPSPRPLQLICQRCHLSIRRVTHVTPLSFWHGTLHDLGYDTF